MVAYRVEGDGMQRRGLRIHVRICEYYVVEPSWEGTGSQAQY